MKNRKFFIDVKSENLKKKKRERIEYLCISIYRRLMRQDIGCNVDKVCIFYTNQLYYLIYCVLLTKNTEYFFITIEAVHL